MSGIEDLFIAAGYMSHGLANGPMCVKAVAEMMLHGRSGER